MAFATVGDTTNVTSRLQSLTRDLRVRIVASGALVAAVEREAADPALLLGLTSRGPPCCGGATRRSSCGRNSRRHGPERTIFKVTLEIADIDPASAAVRDP